MKSIIIDANIILRYLLADNSEFFEKSKVLFDKALNNELEILIKEIVITEVVYVLEKFYKVERKQIAEILTSLILLRGIKIENRNYILKAFKIYKNKKLDFVDCVLCSMSKDYKIETFDKKLNNCINNKEAREGWKLQ